MAAHETTTRTVPTQPSRRLHKGDAIISLSEMVDAQEGTPLSVDEVLDRISRRDREDGQ